MKLRWMIDNYSQVSEAHETDDLLFGTVESWIVYVPISLDPLHSHSLTLLDLRILSGDVQKDSTSLTSQMLPAHFFSTLEPSNGNQHS
jgi:hypothetical protein